MIVKKTPKVTPKQNEEIIDSKLLLFKTTPYENST